MTVSPRPQMTAAEYLEREATSDLKHEFINGEAFAMAGGTKNHGALAIAFGGDLRAALIGKPCRQYSSDVRVHVAATGAWFYPDLSVVCGKDESPRTDPNAIANPIVLVEVLSESTEAYDRGAKAIHYRHLESLREYVLVSQTEPRVEVQRKNERGIWELHFFGPGERLELTSLGVTLSIDALYANPLQA